MTQKAHDELARSVIQLLLREPFFGHLLGAAGSVEAVFSLLAMRDNIAPPTINLDNPSVQPKLDLAPNKAVKRKIDVALSNSFGFGGTNASLGLGKVR